MATLRQMRIASRHGIKRPYRTGRAAKKAGIPFWAACAFLMQESGGGSNVFGHDPTIFIGAGTVTKDKYLRYKRERGTPGKHMQGVGPMQLTWWEFQDEADRAGGCWRPYINMLIGFRLIKRYRDADLSWHNVAVRYNGSESYADQMDDRFKYWRRILS